MVETIPYDARRFKSAAKHYLSGRPAYPDRLVHNVAKLIDLTGSDRVLDLGCGPGQLALAFAPFVQSVLAVDPEPEMLELCRSQLVQAGYSNVETRLGSSNELDASFGRFNVALIGRAFHWMDRTATLLRLHEMLALGGAVILFGDHHPKLPQNSWIADFDAIVDRYAAADPGRQIRKSPSWINHEALLLQSPFCQLERASVIVRHVMSCDGLIERALSRSSTSAGRLGAHADEMVADLRQRFGRTDPLIEVVEIEALIARRPS